MNSISKESIVSVKSKKVDKTTERQTEEIDSMCPPALTKQGYKLGELIGKGNFASVYMATKESKPNKVLACKRIDIDSVPQKWKEKCLKLELKVLKKLSHPYIVKTHDLIKTRSTVFIFMDYCLNGSIYKLLEKQKAPFPELKAKVWFSQILGALSYCHSKGVAHRDLKLENFLLNEDEDAMLTDFGFATLGTRKNADIMRDTSCGHPAYMAPEVFDTTKVWPYDAKAADMYSMGVCLYEMLNFDKPFDANLAINNPRLYVMKQRNREYKLHSNVESKLSEPIKDLIKQLLDPIPATRISTEHTLIHIGLIPYLQ